ncbi:MAG: C-type lectin domain-containing protein [Mogibacterium sp.]|nr:C-type lectin domain-containing protein [Mogibacterium sp.]
MGNINTESTMEILVRRRRSRTAVVVAVLLFLAAVAACAAVLLSRGGTTGQSAVGSGEGFAAMGQESARGIESSVRRVDGVRAWNGHYYKLVDRPGYWTDAEQSCRGMGGHLVTITSPEEQAFIESLIENDGTLYHYWIGATDREVEGTFRWVTGEVIDENSYTHWEEDQPNNSLTEDPVNGQDYVEIQATRGDNGAEEYMTWTDIIDSGVSDLYKEAPEYNDTQYYGFICEWDSAADVQ